MRVVDGRIGYVSNDPIGTRDTGRMPLGGQLKDFASGQGICQKRGTGKNFQPRGRKMVSESRVVGVAGEVKARGESKAVTVQGRGI